MMQYRHLRTILFVTVSLLLFIITLLFVTPVTQANPQGAVDLHGAFGTSCNDCHYDGQAPTVTVTGSTLAQPSQTLMYMLSITSTAPLSQTHAGWNIAVLDAGFANAGTLAVIDGDSSNQAAQGQLTQTAPLANVDGVANVVFKWTAPATPGTYTMHFVGNSVDNNWEPQEVNGSIGDLATLGTLTITVASATTQIALTQTGIATAAMGHPLIALLFLSLLTYLIRFRKAGRLKGR